MTDDKQQAKCPECNGEGITHEFDNDIHHDEPCGDCGGTGTRPEQGSAEPPSQNDEFGRMKAQKDAIVKRQENELIAERDREWGIALCEIGVAMRAKSERHGKITVEHEDEIATLRASLKKAERRVKRLNEAQIEHGKEYWAWREKFNTAIMDFDGAKYAGWHFLESACDATKRAEAAEASLLAKEAENEKLREALRKYADENNWVEAESTHDGDKYSAYQSEYWEGYMDARIALGAEEGKRD